MDPVKRRLRGITLVLVAGLLSLLAFLALAVGQTARVVREASESCGSARRAALSAESGLAYAAARLWQDPFAVAGPRRNPANACDDWTCRDPSDAPEPATTRPKNPSYSHSEPWTDSDGGTPGRFDPGETWTDEDGNGRFDAASGRLRGGASFFSLRIRATASLVCVNSGELGSPLGDHNLDGIPNREDPLYRDDLNFDSSGGSVGNGIPDWRDPGYVGNRHIVNVLDNLGGILELSIAVRAPYAPEAPQLGQVETSTLGTLVVSRRPRGGYTSIRELASFLSAADYERVAPFLGIAGEIVPIPFQSEGIAKESCDQIVLYNPAGRHEFHARVDLNNAPVETLKACLRHVSASGAGGEDVSNQVNAPFFRLQAEEADAIAEFITGNRPFHTWRQLLAALADPALLPDSAFRDDPFLRDPDVYDAFHKDRMRTLKEDLVLAQFDANWLTQDVFSWRRGCLEVEREPAGFAPRPDATRVIQVSKELLGGTLSTVPFRDDGEYDPWNPEQGLKGIPGRITLEQTLAPSAACFSVDARGWHAGTDALPLADRRAGAEMAIGGTPLLLTGQQDFEHLGTGTVAPARPWRYGGGGVEAVTPVQERRGIQSFPRFPYASPGRQNYPRPTPPGTAYPAAYGRLQLASRQPDDAELSGHGAFFSMPFNEDQAPGPLNRYDPAGTFDNTIDPVNRDPGPAGTVMSAMLHVLGIWSSPVGHRNPGGTSITWPVSPFGLSGSGISGGTISFWYVQTGMEEVEDLAYGSRSPARIALHYFNATGGSIEYLAVTHEPDRGRVLVSNLTGMNARNYQTDLPPPHLTASPWHHVAVTFEPLGGGETGARVHVDGTLVSGTGAYPLRFDPGYPPAGPQIQVFPSGAIDDVLFFPGSLSPQEIAGIARRPRFHIDPDGSSPAFYRSPRFRFDPARFPRGACLTGAAWDAFIPKETGGRFVFEVIGLDEGGLPRGTSGPIPYAGGDAPQMRPFRIPGCRHAEFTVTILTDPAAWPLVEGEPSLRDTPILDEFRILYGPDRPGWTAY